MSSSSSSPLIFLILLILLLLWIHKAIFHLSVESCLHKYLLCGGPKLYPPPPPSPPSPPYTSWQNWPHSRHKGGVDQPGPLLTCSIHRLKLSHSCSPSTSQSCMSSLLLVHISPKISKSMQHSDGTWGNWGFVWENIGKDCFQIFQKFSKSEAAMTFFRFCWIASF